MTKVDESLAQIPAELKPYKARYERMQERRKKEGIFVLAYEVLFALFNDRQLSLEEIGKKIAELNRNARGSAISSLSSIRRQFFPSTVGNAHKKKETERKAEIERQEAEFKRSNQNYLELASVCNPLVPEVIWDSYKDYILVEMFDVGGVRCFVSREHTASVQRANHRPRVHVTLPHLHESSYEVSIHFVDMTEGESKHRNVFFFPLGEDRPTQRKRLAIPVGERKHSGGGPRKYDFDRYRGEKGLAILKEKIEEKRKLSEASEAQTERDRLT